uniref:Uncharacterized protein n=1 Tax=Cacopsylla melanoneura TaxID=428564 RepID=A0A8D9AX92_9HEMI
MNQALTVSTSGSPSFSTILPTVTSARSTTCPSSMILRSMLKCWEMKAMLFAALTRVLVLHSLSLKSRRKPRIFIWNTSSICSTGFDSLHKFSQRFFASSEMSYKVIFFWSLQLSLQGQTFHFCFKAPPVSSRFGEGVIFFLFNYFLHDCFMPT